MKRGTESCCFLDPLRLPYLRPRLFSSQGEYVAVERIETVVSGACPLVAQIWVHAEPGARRLVAVVVPDAER